MPTKTTRYRSTTTRRKTGMWLLLVLLLPPTASAGDLLVFAAASTSDALTEASRLFEEPVSFNFAGSNTLAHQLLYGARGDLYVSANVEQMKRLVARGKVRADEVVELLSNRLVVVARRRSHPELSQARDLLRFERLALADPDAVPAGVYAREWLQAQGVWADLEARIVPGLDVRSTVAAVAAGHVPAGVVYATDAAATAGVVVVYRVPEAETPLIRYLAAPLGGREEETARRFLVVLCGDAARQVFLRHGFGHLPCTRPERFP